MEIINTYYIFIFLYLILHTFPRKTIRIGIQKNYKVHVMVTHLFVYVNVSRTITNFLSTAAKYQNSKLSSSKRPILLTIVRWIEWEWIKRNQTKQKLAKTVEWSTHRTQIYLATDHCLGAFMLLCSGRPHSLDVRIPSPVCRADRVDSINWICWWWYINH